MVTRYIHTSRVSSGKGHKMITTVYEDEKRAFAELALLGGKLEICKVLDVKEKQNVRIK